jgi:DNA primase
VAALAHRHQSQVVVAMDADGAGRKAALDAGERLRYAAADVRVASLPNGSDPAAYLARSAGTLDIFRFEAGLPLITLRLQNAITLQGDRMQWIEGRLAALRDISTYLATYPSSHAARQIGWLADVLHLDSTTVTNELAFAFGRSAAARNAYGASGVRVSSVPVASRAIGGVA